MTSTTEWLVQIEEDGLGEIVWQGPALNALEAVRAYAAATGRDLPAHPLDGFRDVNRNGSRFESEGPRQLVIERLA